MQFFWDLLRNRILISSIIGWAVAQFGKVFVNFVLTRRVRLSLLFADGGMPSAHSATVASLCCAVGLYQGFDSAIFALAAIFAVVVLRDAVGVRRYVGVHAFTLNQMSDAFNKAIGYELLSNDLNESQGHTLRQVAAGCVTGIVVALLVYYIGR